MRQGQQNRRGRNRNNGGRKVQNTLSRNYESSGPDVKIRGSASHIAEKYISLARDALASGDLIVAENLYQHAEHYNRLIMASYETEQQQPYMNGYSEGQGIIQSNSREGLDASLHESARDVVLSEGQVEQNSFVAQDLLQDAQADHPNGDFEGRSDQKYHRRKPERSSNGRVDTDEFNLSTGVAETLAKVGRSNHLSRDPASISEQSSHQSFSSRQSQNRQSQGRQSQGRQSQNRQSQGRQSQGRQDQARQRDDRQGSNRQMRRPPARERQSNELNGRDHNENMRRPRRNANHNPSGNSEEYYNGARQHTGRSSTAHQNAQQGQFSEKSYDDRKDNRRNGGQNKPDRNGAERGGSRHHTRRRRRPRPQQEDQTNTFQDNGNGLSGASDGAEALRSLPKKSEQPVVELT